ncbi:MAG: alpha-xylosidase [Clostridia bacterium]|nr:alpha-xylosidase [Clostridia bacterium]
MIDKHLTVEVKPIADGGNTVVSSGRRVTVLSDRLFRVEFDDDGCFTDSATQTVWYRDMPPVAYSCATDGDDIVISTEKVTLSVGKTSDDIYAMVNGVRVKADNSGNLHATARTLDGYDGDECRQEYVESHVGNKLDLGNGVCSKSGVAVLDDSKSLIFDGVTLYERKETVDLYIFAFGHDYRAAVCAYYMISGAPPIIPRYALGNWWSRYHAYSDREYLQLIGKFEKYGIPLTVGIIDMDWHYSTDTDTRFRITERGRDNYYYGFKSGWTGFSWNKELFPDHKGFLTELKSKKLKTGLNLHPHNGVRWFEDMYADFARAVGIDPATEERVVFNMLNDKFVNAYFDVIMKPYERDGVDFWWIDYQQAISGAIKGFDPLWALNHYHYLDNAKNHDHPIILSRFCGHGAQRYPIGFSGDTFITWNTLSYEPYFTATASNIGYTWWSHDIGGHMRGRQERELYLRSIQFGVFSPINRLHSCNEPSFTKEPWAYKNGICDLAVRALRFRRAMMPMLYTASVLTHTQGRAIVEPMYYQYDEDAAYKYKNEYLFMGMLVCPVTSPTDEYGYSAVSAWIPDGEWTDIFTGEKYYGNCEKTLYRTLDSIPVLAKAGSVLVLDDDDRHNGSDLPQRLNIRVFRGDGEYTLFEDADGMVAYTHIDNISDGNVQRVRITVSGDDSVIPCGRSISVEFADIFDGKLCVTVNGQSRDGCEEYADRPTVVIDGVSSGTVMEIAAEYVPYDRLTYLKKTVCTLFQSFEGDVMIKDSVYKALIDSDTVGEYVRVSNGETVPEYAKRKLNETVCG